MPSAQEQYRQVHQDYMRCMYDLMLTDEGLHARFENVMHRLLNACFEFGAEEAKNTWTPQGIQDVF